MASIRSSAFPASTMWKCTAPCRAPRSSMSWCATRGRASWRSYAGATSKPGVCFTITGPGLLNILTPMGQAWSDSNNVLVISTAMISATRRKAVAASMKCRPARRCPPNHQPRHARLHSATCAIVPGLRQLCAGPDPPISKFPRRFADAGGNGGWTARSLLTNRHPLKPDRSHCQKLNGAKTPVILLGGGALDAGKAAVGCRKTGLRHSRLAGKGSVMEIIRSVSAIAWATRRLKNTAAEVIACWRSAPSFREPISGTPKLSSPRI